MNENILQILRAKFQGTHENVVDSVTEHLSKTVIYESQIETAIAVGEILVKLFVIILQKDDDVRYKCPKICSL